MCLTGLIQPTGSVVKWLWQPKQQRNIIETEMKEMPPKTARQTKETLFKKTIKLLMDMHHA